MRVVCPGCSIVYEPPAELLTPGRRMRCARCGETWSLPGSPPPPPATAEIEPPSAEPEGPPIVERVIAAPPVAARRIAVDAGSLLTTTSRRQADEPVYPSRSPAVVGAWLVTCVVLAGIAWGAYTYRSEVMVAWPPSTRVYAGLGLMK